MELYSLVTALIGQNGRRGALMISIDCSHPDVEEFIRSEDRSGEGDESKYFCPHT